MIVEKFDNDGRHRFHAATKKPSALLDAVLVSEVIAQTEPARVTLQ